MIATTYLSDDRHEVRLVNILLDVLKFWLFDVRIRIMIDEQHEAFAIFLRQGVVLLSRTGVEINFVSERVDEGANGSFLVDTTRHVLKGEFTVAAINGSCEIPATAAALGHLGALGNLGSFWPFDGLTCTWRTWSC